MPELPEVQTTVSDLNKKVAGDTITDFWSDWPKTIQSHSLKNFTKEIKDKKILRARRIGKNLFIDLSGDKTIYIHLKMTGHLLVKKQETRDKRQGERKNYFDEKVNQYVHHIWKLKTKNGKRKTLEFSDLRKFGKIVLIKTSEVEKLKEIAALGPDALSSDFSFEYFENILEKKKKSPIGIVLMDQSLISGIGNIYRSETLFGAKISPKRLAGKVSSKERKELYKSIRKILEKATKMRGTSDSDFRDTSGAPGNFQKVLRVYRREGKKCSTNLQSGKKCGTMVKRFKMAQRSVFYCPKCQK